MVSTIKDVPQELSSQLISVTNKSAAKSNGNNIILQVNAIGFDPVPLGDEQEFIKQHPNMISKVDLNLRNDLYTNMKSGFAALVGNCPENAIKVQFALITALRLTNLYLIEESRGGGGGKDPTCCASSGCAKGCSTEEDCCLGDSRSPSCNCNAKTSAHKPCSCVLFTNYRRAFANQLYLLIVSALLLIAFAYHTFGVEVRVTCLADESNVAVMNPSNETLNVSD